MDKDLNEIKFNFSSDHHQHLIRSCLQETILKRCRNNPRYSLRAFARSLKIEPSALSKLIHGKRKITYSMFNHLCQNLDLTTEFVKKFSSPNESMFDDHNLDSSYQTLTLDTFQVISEWYHYAILELTKIKNFKPDSKWIANSLGITPSEVQMAKKRLIRLGFLEVDTRGQWHDKSGNITTVGNAITNNAFKKLQKQVLEKAISALETIPLDQRNQSSVTIAVDQDLIPEIEDKIKKFRRQLTQYIEFKGNSTAVYHLSISLYPITNLSKEHEE